MASEPESLPPAARRADAGLVRATKRDLRLLRWTAEQYAGVDSAAGAVDGSLGGCGALVARRVAAGGLSAGRTLLAGQPVFVSSRVTVARGVRELQAVRAERRGVGAHRGGQRRAAAGRAAPSAGGVGV
jgi:hypothetical protein